MTIWTGAALIRFYQRLNDVYGPQHWWPAKTPFETIIGAILAQNVSWTGAHNAVCQLRERGLMHPHALYEAGPEVIAPLIRSSRYYNQKSQKIHTFLRYFLTHYHGSVSRMVENPETQIREELISLRGFGPETVDSILLYALMKPVFVVDAYTRRMGSRIGWFDEAVTYEDMQDFFMSRLPRDVPLYNDFHAQIVYLGNHVCKKNPQCMSCPVREKKTFPGCRYGVRILKTRKGKLPDE